MIPPQLTPSSSPTGSESIHAADDVKASAVDDASIDDYKAFHGMLCRPSAAQRCIRSFTGRVLFLPNDAVDATTSSIDWRSYDYNRKTNDGAVPRLNLIAYYGLVIFSFTGLSTVCNQTQLLSDPLNVGKDPVIDVQKPLVSSVHPFLKLDPSALQYLLQDEENGDGDKVNIIGSSPTKQRNQWRQQQQSNKQLVLKRRFEFSFGGFIPIQVVMWHIVTVHLDNSGIDDTLHLVEVYRVQYPFVQKLLKTIHGILHYLKHDRYPDANSKRKSGNLKDD